MHRSPRLLEWTVRYSASDACFIFDQSVLFLSAAAVEKQKFVYVMNRDAASNLTISSPLEAHKSHTIVFDMCALDVGYENPIFACLELDVSAADEDASGQVAAETPKVRPYLAVYVLITPCVRLCVCVCTNSTLEFTPSLSLSPSLSFFLFVCTVQHACTLSIHQSHISSSLPLDVWKLT